jgi:hypothetical protein
MTSKINFINLEESRKQSFPSKKNQLFFRRGQKAEGDNRDRSAGEGKSSHDLCWFISRMSFGVQAKGGEIFGLKDDREKNMLSHYVQVLKIYNSMSKEVQYEINSNIRTRSLHRRH